MSVDDNFNKLLEEGYDEEFVEFIKANIEVERGDMNRENILVLNPKKALVVQKLYKQLCFLLNKNEAKYTIDFINNPYLPKQIFIRVVTDCFAANSEVISVYREIANNIDGISQHIDDDNKDRWIISMGIDDVFIEVQTDE